MSNSSTKNDIKSKSKLVTFLYLMMRDVVPTGEIAKTILDADSLEPERVFTNPHLAALASDYADRLIDEVDEV